MNDKGKKAIEDLKRTIKLYENKPKERISVNFDNFDYEICTTILNLIENQKAEIEKKDKIINSMAKWINHHTRYYDDDGCYCEIINTICDKDIKCEECIKQYFEKKAEGNNNE